MTSAGEVVFKFMEGACHDSIGEVESFFDTVTMVDINIDVEDSLVSFKELKDGQHAVVDVAEAGSL